jgi:hypothetical protein
MQHNKFIDKERIDFLSEKVKASSKKGLLPAWPRTEKELPLVDLEVDWVCLSTLNHRTRAEQRRAIHMTGKADLFTMDPMGQTAQKAQYEILCGQPGFKDLKIDLGERGQQEHAVVTAEGVLINGNRRTAALRSLLHDDKNLNCRYVRSLVLPPDSTPSEILQLETELQVARDFKQEYSWVNQALLIEELYESNGRDFSAVAAWMRLKEKEIREDYEKIQQVNQLVALSQGRWLHVDFEPNESAFNELAQHIRNKNDGEREAVRSVYFLGTLAGVNYRDLRHLRRADAEDLVGDELRSEEQLSEILEAAAVKYKDVGQDDDLLDDVLGDSASTSVVRQTLEFVAGLDKEKPVELPSGTEVEIADIYDLLGRVVTKAAEEAEEQRKDINAVRTPIVRLERALAEITRARDSLATARAIAGWDEALFSAKIDAVETKLNELKDSE